MNEIKLDTCVIICLVDPQNTEFIRAELSIEYIMEQIDNNGGQPWATVLQDQQYA